MKKIINAGLTLVLIAFLHSLISVFAGYWEEPGGSKDTLEVYTNFADWEYFYHETFENALVQKTNQTFYAFDAEFNIEGEVIDANNQYSIKGKSVLLVGAQKIAIKLPRGVGGFSFDYLALGNVNDVLEVSVYDDHYKTKEPLSTTMVDGELNKVLNHRSDFNIPASNKTVYVVIENKNNTTVIIDNIKWSDHNILVTLKDGYNDNEVIGTEYVRYGRLVKGYLDSFTREGYKDFKWYTDSALQNEFNELTPIRDNLTLYLDRELVVYEIEYVLNGGFFEPFENRDAMIVGFLTDLYHYLDDNGMLEGGEFHNILKEQRLAGETITLNDFIYGLGRDENSSHEGIYGGKYDGLFTKGMVVNTFEDEDEYPINFELNGGIFANIGGVSYTNRTTMKNDFLKDFHTYLVNNHGYTGTLNDFRHGPNKTTGFNGDYENYVNLLFTMNNKTVNANLKTFINQPEYNKWVPLIDLMDSYTKVGNPVQSFWGSHFVAALRFKPFMREINMWANEGEPKATNIKNIVQTIPQTIKTGGTPQIPPVKYDGTQVITLPTPTKGTEVFNGWYTYDYETETFSSAKVTQINAGEKGAKYFYARFGDSYPTPIPYDELPKSLRKDSYFSQIYEMDLDWDVDKFNLDYQTSNLKLIKEGKAPIDKFINQPEYNKWVPLLQLIHEYTAYGNPAQEWHGIWKSHYTGTIRMEMFFQQYNPWVVSQRSELQYTVFEMLRRVPHEIPSKKVIYTYTVESDDIDLLNLVKDNADFNGWHLDSSFLDDKITKIPKGSTGDITLHAYFNDKKYDITYDLDGGEFAPYTNRTEMIDHFLDDFYDFSKKILNSDFTLRRDDFKHGIGKESGFDGEYTKYIYYSDKVERIPVQLLFATGNKNIDPQTKRFINQEDYNNRWLPLLLMAEDFTKEANPSDDFWNNPKLASERLKQLFTNVRPSGATNAIDKYFTMIPKDIPKDKVAYYYVNTEVTTLPTPVKEGYRFIGWNEESTDQIVWTEVPVNTARELNFTAIWSAEGSYFVTYDFGEYGYYGNTQNELFLAFINNYKDLFGFPPAVTDERFYNDFFNTSKLTYSGEKDINEIFSYNVDYWKWLKDYILTQGMQESYPHQTKLDDNDEEIWRLNFDAFFNKRQSSYVNSEFETIYSIDFSSLEAGNSFWKDTPYNKYKIELIPGDPVVDDDFIKGWHPGYIFAGWYDSLVGGTKVTTLSLTPTGDTTLYARWEKAAGIIVTFVDYDDSVIEVKTFEIDETVTAPNDPFREHYNFTGWDKELSSIDSSTIVKALYSPHTYTLKFETNGGSSIDPQTLVYPEHPVKPEEPTKEGYEFVNWYSNEELNHIFYFDFPLFGEKDGDTITIYAKWEAVVYNITYHLNTGEENHEDNPETYTNLDVITLLPATKENHNFMGWYDNDEFNGEAIDVIFDRTGDLDLYAKFEIYQYTITFDSMGGSDISEQKVKHGETVVKPEDPDKDGFVFTHWSTNGDPYDFNTPIKENLTLYANYSESIYSVIFYDENNVIYQQYDVLHGEYVTIPDVPDKQEGAEGYTKSWNPILTNVNIYQDYDVRPVYTAIEYDITYHLDGGINPINNPIKYTIKSKFTLSDATKDGYTFVGWYLDSGFNNPITEIENRTGDLNLYAQFTEKAFNINYHLDGGTNDTNNPSTYTVSSFIILGDATKDGYEFLGWYQTADFSGDKIEIIDGLTGDLDLYAKFSEPVYYDIYYVLYEEEHEPNDPVDFNPTVIKYITTEKAILSVPDHRTSSLFMGWYDNPEFSGEVITEITVGSTGHKTFYAKWKLREYQIEVYNSENDFITSQSPQKIISNITHSSIVNLDAYSGSIEEGKEFIGWHYIDGSDEVLFEQNQQINKDFKVYPKFGLKKYTVTFYSGLSVFDTREVYHGGTIPNLPINSNSNFLNWELEDGTVFNETTSVTSDLVVLAKFSDSNGEYIVIFEYIDEEEKTVQTPVIVSGNKLTSDQIPEPNRVGYTFDHWKHNSSEYSKSDLLDISITNNYTFVASYTIKSYTVKFYNDKTLSDLLDEVIVEHGSTAVYSKSTPTRANSIFTGWSDELVNITEDKDIYALFALNKYYVRFYDSNDILLKEELVEHGSSATAPSAPEKAHYTFSGWDEDFSSVTSHLNVKATYTGNTYTLEFDTVGGSSVVSQELIYPDRTTKPVNPTREGYLFAGWYTTITGGSPYQFNQSLTGDVTIYARWTEQTVKVKFMIDGILSSEKTISYNTTVSEPTAPTKAGHSFTGWYLNDDKFSFTTPITENITLNAGFEVNELTVLYLDDDDTQLHLIKVNYGGIIPVPSLPTDRSGYTVSWSQNLTNYVITEDITVKAVYTPITYTITYLGLFNGINNSNPLTYTIVSENITLDAPTNIPTGNVFVGWFTSSTGGTEVTSIPKGSTGNKTLYAQWDLTNYTITYNLDGGQFAGYSDRKAMIDDFLKDFHDFLVSQNAISMILDDFKHGTDKTSGYDGFYGLLSDETYPYFNYLYDANDRRIDATTGKFINQPEYNKWALLLDVMEEYTQLGEQGFWSSPYTGARRIKSFIQEAKPAGAWNHIPIEDVKAITGKIPTGLSSAVIYYEYNLNSPTITLPTPTKANHTFLGWYTSSTGGTKVANIPIGSTGNKTFYARWSIPTYTITYNLEGGKFDSYTTKADLIDGFMQDLYDYLGATETYEAFKAGIWYSKEAYKSKIYNGVEPEENNEAFFISASKYRTKWAPFFKMMDQFVKVGNPSQSFFGGTFTGLMRLEQYIKGVKPNAAWTNDDMAMMPDPAIKVNAQTTYNPNIRTIVLPKPVRDDHAFEGWYTNKNYSGSAVTTIEKNATGNKVFYAKWRALVTFSDFIKKPMTQNNAYILNNTNSSYRRTRTLGVIILSSAVPGVNADGWFTRWNANSDQIATHVVLDNTKTMQLLEWNYRGHHTASQGNLDYVAVMIAENSGYSYNGKTMVNYNKSAQEAYFNAVWERAVAITVYILKHYNIKNVSQTTVVGRHEAFELGLSVTSLANPGLLFSQHDKSMDDFRIAVSQRM